MHKPVDVIEVRIWSKTAGAVAFDNKLGCYVFEYAGTFARSGIELSPLLMRLDPTKRTFAFPGLSVNTFMGLPPMLADALPDAFGNALINAYLARQGISSAQITALDRLAYMGRRGMGALEFRPVHGPAKTSSLIALDLKDLVEAARKAVSGSFANDQATNAALSNILRVGTSAGGARAKAVVAWNRSTGEICPGQFEAAPGFEHWLLKFDGVSAGALGDGMNFGRIEYAYYLMATAAGIDMAPSELIEENGRAHFMTKRFDRDGDRKHHLQSLCAMKHLDFNQRATHDYMQLFMAIDEMNLGVDARSQVFRRMVFNVLAANCDDHTKNHAFILRQDEAWALSPAYDVTHAYNPSGEWTFQHLMSVNGKFADITQADVMAVAERCEVSNAKDIIRAVEGTVGNWPTYAKQAGLPKEEIARIDRDLASKRQSFW